MHRDTLVAHLNDLLRVDDFRDGQVNGLQVAGREDVERVVLAVSASAGVFEEAAERDADAVLTHHGLLWGELPGAITGQLRRRLKLLLDDDVNLLSYHLPLDAHPTLGHNALAVERLGLADRATFGTFNGMRIGFKGRYDDPVPLDTLVGRLVDLYGRDPLVLRHGPDPVHEVAVVSGAGQSAIDEAVAEGVDVLVTGEVREQTYYQSLEGDVTFIACGHHATERLGLLALGAHLEKEFGLECHFVDVANPV